MRDGHGVLENIKSVQCIFTSSVVARPLALGLPLAATARVTAATRHSLYVSLHKKKLVMWDVYMYTQGRGEEHKPRKGESEKEKRSRDRGEMNELSVKMSLSTLLTAMFPHGCLKGKRFSC